MIALRPVKRLRKEKGGPRSSDALTFKNATRSEAAWQRPLLTSRAVQSEGISRNPIIVHNNSSGKSASQFLLQHMYGRSVGLCVVHRPTYVYCKGALTDASTGIARLNLAAVSLTQLTSWESRNGPPGIWLFFCILCY
jgi:hypothetical protein